jgi:hypothetical protein
MRITVMTLRIIVYTSALLMMLTLVAGCSPAAPTIQEEPQIIAEHFVKNDSTYLFDGMPETFKFTSTSLLEAGGKYTFEFDCRHAGYGDRTGQILAQVITHHSAIVTIQAGKVTSAMIDGVWDMVKQRPLDNIEIDLAPIHEVTVSILKSNPPQIAVLIKGGLRDGCTAFYNIEVTREGTSVNIKVYTCHPKDQACPAIYTFFEKYINLGSDFTMVTTYTLNVNDYTTTFTL